MKMWQWWLIVGAGVSSVLALGALTGFFHLFNPHGLPNFQIIPNGTMIPVLKS